MPAKKAPSTLSGKAAALWEKVYAEAWDRYDPDKHEGTQEEFAAKNAWGVLKKSYRKNKDDKWVKKSMSTFSLRITKARVDGETGRIRWHANAASDEMFEGEDEILHVSLFDDLANTFQEIRAAYDNGEEPPVYDEYMGVAQEPILDLSHYSARLSLEDRNTARLGSVTKLYRDGNHLHADGFFDETPQGQLVAKSIAADETGDIRVSVGFFPDYGNIEIVNDVFFWKGGRDRAYLDHLAVTSCPRIPTTSIEAEEVMMSDAKTQAEDALVILGEEGEELIQELEDKVEKRLQGKSMVLKADSETETEGDVETEEEIVEPETVEMEEVEQETLSETTTDEDTETEEISGETEGEEEIVESELVLESEVVEMGVTEPGVPDSTGPGCNSEVDVVEVIVEEKQTGPTSFDAAIEALEARQEAWRISDGWYMLQDVMENILKDDEIEDKNAAINIALSQYQDFLNSGKTMFSEADVEIEPEVVVEPEPEVVEQVVEPIVPAQVQPVPPEAQPFSTVELDTSATKRGKASTWGDVLDRVAVTEPKTEIVQPIAAVETIEQPTSDVDVTSLVDNRIAEIVNPLLAEMAALRNALEQGASVKETPAVTPQRGVRKSRPTAPPISPASETTRQKTFGDVVDQIRGQRRDLYGPIDS